MKAQTLHKIQMYIDVWYSDTIMVLNSYHELHVHCLVAIQRWLQKQRAKYRSNQLHHDLNPKIPNNLQVDKQISCKMYIVRLNLSSKNLFVFRFV